MATLETPASAATSNGGAADGQIPIENPATGQTIGHVPDMSADEVTRLVEAARAAQPSWAEMGYDARAKVFKRARKWLVDNRDRLAHTIVEETGKTREDAMLAEGRFIADTFGYWAK